MHSEEGPENNEYNPEDNEIGTIWLQHIELDDPAVGSVKVGHLTVILCLFVSTKDETTIQPLDGSENNEYNPENNEIGITDSQHI